MTQGFPGEEAEEDSSLFEEVTDVTIQPHLTDQASTSEGMHIHPAIHPGQVPYRFCRTLV